VPCGLMINGVCRILCSCSRKKPWVEEDDFKLGGGALKVQGKRKEISVYRSIVSRAHVRIDPKSKSSCLDFIVVFSINFNNQQ
jgi:hypothetical protein